MQVSVHDVQQRVAGASTFANIIRTSRIACQAKKRDFLRFWVQDKNRNEDVLTAMHHTVAIHLCFPRALAGKLEFLSGYFRCKCWVGS